MAWKAIFNAAVAALVIATFLGTGMAQASPGAFPGEPADPESIFLDEPERKDPFVAGLLSWSWTGLGHFYTQHYTRGSLFLMTDLLQKGLLIYGVFHYSDKYRSNDDGIARWENIPRRDRGIIIGYVFSMLLVKVLGVVDAVNSAETYNREIYFPYWKNRARMRLSVETAGNRIDVSMSCPFQF